MVEQKLDDVIDNLRYLPDILEKEFTGMELSPDLSVSDCWNHMVQTLGAPQLAPFWAHCGFTDPETITALLGALRSAVLTACIYYGVDYQFDCNSRKGEPAYFQVFGFPYMKHLFGDNYHGFSASASSRPYRDYNDVRRKIEAGLQNAARIYDPLGFNPLLIQRQREDYASRNKKNILSNYFPEINLFLLKVCGNIVPESRELNGKKLKGWLRYDKGRAYFHTPLWAVFFLLAYHEDYLPGHKNTYQGKLTMHSLANLDMSIQELYQAMDSANLLAPEVDKVFSSLLTDYALEDLLHLNRLSGALKQCIDYVHDKKVKQVKKDFLPLVFSTLVYAPSLEVQDFMKTDVELFADAVLYEPSKEEHFPAMQRVLSISSIVFPSLVCIFSRLLYLQKGQISPVLLDERLSRISSDDLIRELKSSFSRKGKTWDDPLYFSTGIRYKQGHKKGKQTKLSYWGPNDSSPDHTAGTVKAAAGKLPLPDELLFIMMKQDLLKTGTIIMQNQIVTNVQSVLRGWEHASKNKSGETGFLYGMIFCWWKELGILPEPPEN